MKITSGYIFCAKIATNYSAFKKCGHLFVRTFFVKISWLGFDDHGLHLELFKCRCTRIQIRCSDGRNFLVEGIRAGRV